VIPSTLLLSNPTVDEKVIWIKENQHICRWPWSREQINFINDRPVSTPCCNAKADYDDFDRSSNLQYQQIKQAMIAGNTHELCKVCTANEAQNMSSERIQGLVDMPWNSIQNLLTYHSEEKNYFSIKLSNFCNLACRSCQPEDSSTYSQIYKKIDNSFDLSSDSLIWDKIKNKIRNSANEKPTIVNLLGGETTIQPGFYKFIDFILEENLKDQVSICLTSNITALTKEFFDQVSQLNSVMITASIDSVGKNYHYVRWPAKFNKVIENFERLTELKKHMEVCLIIQPVFSLNNIFYFGDYLDFWYHWLKEKNLTDVPIVNINLWHPSFLNPTNIPDPYRRHLRSYLESYVDHPLLHQQNTHYLKVWLTQTIEILKTSACCNFESYLEQTAFFDHSTGTDFAIYNDRLYNLLSDKDKQYFKRCKVL
jgi:hypothetical protein